MLYVALALYSLYSAHVGLRVTTHSHASHKLTHPETNTQGADALGDIILGSWSPAFLFSFFSCLGAHWVFVPVKKVYLSSLPTVNSHLCSSREPQHKSKSRLNIHTPLCYYISVVLSSAEPNVYVMFFTVVRCPVFLAAVASSMHSRGAEPQASILHEAANIYFFCHKSK